MTLPKSDVFQIEAGRCYLVNMNPPQRSKPGKIRPVIVIQSDDTIKIGTPGIVVVPLTTQLSLPDVLRFPIQPTKKLRLEKTSDVLIEQIHTIDRSYFLKELGELENVLFEKIREGVKFLLNLC